MPYVIFNPNRNRWNVMMLRFSWWWKFFSLINPETAETVKVTKFSRLFQRAVKPSVTVVTVIKPGGHEGRKLGAIIRLLPWSLWFPVCFSTGALQRNRKNRYQKKMLLLFPAGHNPEAELRRTLKRPLLAFWEHSSGEEVSSKDRYVKSTNHYI